MEKGNAQSFANSGVAKGSVSAELANATGVYTATCYDAQGNIKWTDTYDNLVTTVGKNDLLDKYLSGVAYTATWYLGLISLTSYTEVNVADTMALHPGWIEDVGYSNTTRVAPSFGAAAIGSKTTTATAFNISATTTIKGTFLTTVSAKSDTTGILYSAGLFTGGDKAVASGDTLNVTYTASV